MRKTIAGILLIFLTVSANAQTATTINKIDDKSVEITTTQLVRTTIQLKDLYARKEVLAVHISMAQAQLAKLEQQIKDIEALGVSK